MAYTWDNRVKYVVRYMYDIDNNGYLDKNDFECLALRNTLIEGRGEFKDEAYATNQKIMNNLWNEIAELADFNKVTVLLALMSTGLTASPGVPSPALRKSTMPTTSSAPMPTIRLEASASPATRSCMPSSSPTLTRSAMPSTFSDP